MQIREFGPKDFEQIVVCYQTGFPEGYNRYSLARLVRIQRDTILVAENKNQIVGVVIGLTTMKEVWINGLTVLPGYGKYSLWLLKKLGERLLTLGFNEAFAATERRSTRSLAIRLGATFVAEESNFYFDGNPRWIYNCDIRQQLFKLNAYLGR